MKIVFATNNAHKLEEARRLAAGRFEILSLADIGCHEELPETADTIEGNALQKASYVKEHYGYDCFSDDTGLFVDALGGAPGVFSARYAGEHCSPDDNMEKLLDAMQWVFDRSARFRTAVCLCAGPDILPTQGPDSTVSLIFEGSVEGSIATERRGSAGFGYDPVFISKDFGISFAEMSPGQKDSVSHRGRALAKLFDFLLSPVSIKS